MSSSLNGQFSLKEQACTWFLCWYWRRSSVTFDVCSVKHTCNVQYMSLPSHGRCSCSCLNASVTVRKSGQCGSVETHVVDDDMSGVQSATVF